MSSSLALNLTLAVLGIDMALAFATIVVKFIRSRQKVKRKQLEALVLHQLTQETFDGSAINAKALYTLCKHSQEAIIFEKNALEQIHTYLENSRYTMVLKRRLSSRSWVRRVEATAKLGVLADRKAIRKALLLALKQERNQVVSLYLFHALAKAKDTRAITIMLPRLQIATPWMATRYQALLLTYKTRLLPYLQHRQQIRRTSFCLLLAEYVYRHPTDTLKNTLIQLAQEQSKTVRVAALRALCRHFPKELLAQSFRESPYRSTAEFVIKAYVNLQDKAYIPVLLSYATRKPLHDQLIQGLSEMAYKDPTLIHTYLDRYEQTIAKEQRQVLASVLDNRLTYLLESYTLPMSRKLRALLIDLVKEHHITGMVQFLNTNTDVQKQQEVGALVSSIAKRSKVLQQQFFTYLHPAVFQELSLKQPKPKQPVAAPHQEKPQRLMLLLILLFTLLVFPLIILVTELPNLVDVSLKELGLLYVVRFNYLLVYYSVTINAIYLVVLAISFKAAQLQNRLYRAKDKQMLFADGLLPSISIIAPAYNEASNIIESTNSLLNQQYPDFELIVVNDGSKDETLKTLITYFSLEKRDQLVPKRLATRPLRGIYRNKNIPNLIVVDKVNGGKADSLNMGLNVATKEFFCGIDADSLLESDALLKAVSTMLDSPVEGIASGGNICPVNGCDVELGSLDRIALPSKFLARLQSLEYMRSFMTGRVGWAYLNTLLIISGAFGIFHRDRTITTGGYLTKSGRYHKDTVGEDMELVVRLSRYMREHNKPYRVHYACNANCWTEVPQTWKVLKRQRDRWHRGLIDILLFHSHMIANPRYGRLGMVGMLYYFLFELIGPLVETQGLFFVMVAAVLGLLNLPIALALFTATIALGILVSLSALFISEFDRPLYSTKDMVRLLWMTMVENFGIRQVISLLRVRAYFSAMQKNRGWGAQVRTGFKASSAQTKKK